MSLNLMTDAWIRVQDATGKSKLIRPHEFTEPGLKLDYPHSVMNEGVRHFIQALVQTVAAPKDDDEWVEMHLTRGENLDFKKRFLSEEDFFDVYGPGYRAFQATPALREWTEDIRKIKKSDLPCATEIGRYRFNTHALGSSSSGFDFDSEKVTRPLPFSMDLGRDPRQRLTPGDAIAFILAAEFRMDAGNKFSRGTSRPGYGNNGSLWYVFSGRDLCEEVLNNILTEPEINALWGQETVPEFEFPWVEESQIEGWRAHDLDYHPLTAFWHLTREWVLPEPDEDGLLDYVDAQPWGNRQRYTAQSEKWEGLPGSRQCIPMSGVWQLPNNATTLKNLKTMGVNGKWTPKDVKDVRAVQTVTNRRTWNVLGSHAYSETLHTPPIITHTKRKAFLYDEVAEHWDEVWGGLPPLRVFGFNMFAGKTVSFFEKYIFIFEGSQALRDEDTFGALVKLTSEVDKVLRAKVACLGGRNNSELWSHTEQAAYDALAKVKLTTNREELEEMVYTPYKRLLATTALTIFDSLVGGRVTRKSRMNTRTITSAVRERAGLEKQLLKLCGTSTKREKNPMNNIVYAHKDEILSVVHKWWRNLHHDKGSGRVALSRAKNLQDVRYMRPAILLEKALEKVVERNLGENAPELQERVFLLAVLLAGLKPTGFKGNRPVARVLAQSRDIKERSFERLCSGGTLNGHWRQLRNVLGRIEGQGADANDLILSLLTWGSQTQMEWTRTYYRAPTKKAS